MRKTALGTDRRPAHCFSVQDDDELVDRHGHQAHFQAAAPARASKKLGAFAFSAPTTECPAVTSAEPVDFPTIRCIAAGALTGSVRVHAATSRRLPALGGARCCSASCACRSTSATGTSCRSAAGATGATTSQSISWVVP